MRIGPADPVILRLRANKSGTTQNWLPWQRPLRNQRNWTGSRKFTQNLPSEKIVKIGPVDTEITLLILKKNKEEITAVGKLPIGLKT